VLDSNFYPQNRKQQKKPSFFVQFLGDPTKIYGLVIPSNFLRLGVKDFA
jgi:hypothetical protein